MSSSEGPGPLDAETRGLTDLLLSLMARGVDVPWEEAAFSRMAVRLFSYQYERNAPYRNFCLHRGVSPASVSRWQDIPAIPTAAFKAASLACFDPRQAAAVYHSSGTSGAGPGKHYLQSLDLYNASLRPAFAAHVLPDGQRLRLILLVPPPAIAPHSSLSHMLAEAARAEVDQPMWAVGETGLLVRALMDTLRRSQQQGTPVALLGTAFAFVSLLDACLTQELRFALPPGSRIMDTGGYKGRTREVSKDELHRLYLRVLGVPESCVINEYGMTEMGSQFYDTALRDAVTGVTRPRRKAGPPWVRTVVMDPETMEPAPPGAIGLLRHVDLANLGSVISIQTDDLGYSLDDGFEIVGRAKGAEARGCSITADELLNAAARGR